MSEASTRPTLLIIGDGAAPTGFARVLENILRPLRDRYDIHHLAVNYFGDPHEVPWKLYPAGAGGDPLGVKRLPDLLGRLRPDLALATGDLPTIGMYNDVLREFSGHLPFIGYFPVESAPVDPRPVIRLRGMERAVLFTRFARRELERAFERAAAVETSSPGEWPRLEVLPHGVDSGTFHPLEPGNPDRDAVRRRAKLEALGGSEEHADSFIVLNANRNQPRKRLDLTLAGFAEFARGKDRHVKLYLHMGLVDRGWDLEELGRRYGIHDRLIVTSDSRGPQHVSDEQLNGIYNAADVGLNTAAAEGWGLVSLEHAASGAPQIVPRHGNCAEIWEGAAELVAPSIDLVDPGSLLTQHILEPESIAAALERLYSDAAHRRDVAERCHALATREEYRWSRLASQWEELLESVLA